MAATSFKTDVSRRAPASQALLDRPYSGPSGQESSSSSDPSFLDNAVEDVNKSIDTDVKALLEGFQSLVTLSRVRDKDKYRIAQENFELEARADVMVRAAQSLTLLSHSLKLSLLLSQEAVDTQEKGEEGLQVKSLDEEAISLIKDTAKHRLRCSQLLQEICGLGGNEAGDQADMERKEEEDVGEDLEMEAVE